MTSRSSSVKSAPIPPERIERLSRGLAGVDGLLAAYLFGSQARGVARPTSDLDVAVLFSHAPEGELVAAALDKCQDALLRDDVDLIVLNGASPIMAFESLSGQRILTNSPNEVAAFESLVAREYEDEMARLDRASRYPST